MPKQRVEVAAPLTGAASPGQHADAKCAGVDRIGQSPNEFELHLRAILGLPIPEITLPGPAASAVILAERESNTYAYSGVNAALALGGDVRLFAKPTTLKNRRMGVALARGETVDEAIALAKRTASCIIIQ